MSLGLSAGPPAPAVLLTTPPLHTTLTRSSGRCLLLLDRLYRRLASGAFLISAVSAAVFITALPGRFRLRLPARQIGSTTLRYVERPWSSILLRQLYLVGILIDPLKDPTWPSLGFAFPLSLTSLLSKDHPKSPFSKTLSVLR